MKPFFNLLVAGLLGTTLCLAQAADTPPKKLPPPKPASGASLLQLDDGRSGKGNLIATTGIRGFSKPATPTSYALIMTIGDYQGNIPKLKGVPFDRATANDIALRMGVPKDNIQSLSDGDLTLDGMRRAFDQLEAKLGGNDQVFIYYSGHGGRQMVQENGNDRCAESLITVDGYGFIDTEMEGVLKRLSQKSQKTIVFLDACHSGGVTTRALSATAPAFAAKSYTPDGVSCVKPTNVVTRSLNANRAPGNGGANFVYIAAATQAWQACMSGAAKDIDGSGGLSAQEIQLCAQDRIEKQLKGAQGFLPHHVSITGNPDVVLSYAVREASAEPASPAAIVAPAKPVVADPPKPVAVVVEPPKPVTVAVEPAKPVPVAASPAQPVPPVVAPLSAPPTKPVPTAASAPASATAMVVPVKPSAMAALKDIYNSRDDRRLVTLTSAKPKLTIGRDLIDLTLTSREAGYVYVLMVGSDGQTFDLLFPNQLDRNNQVAAGATLQLPRDAWQLTAEGPPGKDVLLAIVTDSPRDFSRAGLKPAGPFSVVAASSAQDLQLVTAGAAQTPDADCVQPAAARNLAVQKRCSSSYGAALLTVEEVR
jgi:Domain of unknown function (DUF4384)/Caspase domain